jgi:hypothetical protein
VDIAIELPLTFETGFTNLQFVALAADALASGDVNFANMISSIQTDEARHSQQGGPTLEVLVEHDPGPGPMGGRQGLVASYAPSPSMISPPRPGTVPGVPACCPIWPSRPATCCSWWWA